jgi:hypothetical protein
MQRYKDIDKYFMKAFPKGLDDPNWLDLSKKHASYKKVIDIFKNELSEENFNEYLLRESYKPLIDATLSVINKSTMVNLFEKIAFRNFVDSNANPKDFLEALYNTLYVDYKTHMAALVKELGKFKSLKNANAAKWGIVTCFLIHAEPNLHVIVKPTTTKAIALFLNTDIAYSATPNIESYEKIKNMILDFKKNSALAKGENNIITQAIMYVAINPIHNYS